MTATGVHALTASEYHGDPAEAPSLSASVAKVLCERSPWHAWTAHPRLNPGYAEAGEDKFDLGTAAHALLLQGKDISEGREVMRDDDSVRAARCINVDGQPFAYVVDADDWRTKVAKDVKADARELGLTPLLTHQWEQVEAMAAAVREQLDELAIDPPLLTDGEPEQTLIWREPNGVHCRSRVDWLRTDSRAIDDLKTTSRSADPRQWARTTMWSIGADVQAAFHLRGLRATRGEAGEFRFILCETEPPFAVSIVIPSNAVLELANAKVDWAIEKWAECLETDDWPGYGTDPFYADLPEWAHARWLERTWNPETEEVPV